MSNDLQLLTTREFNGNTLNCYVQQDGTGEFWATREQIGRLLGYANPRKAIKDIHNRNKKRMDMFSSVVRMSTPKRGAQNEPPLGNVQDVTVYNYKGLLEICRYSNQPVADKVIDVLWDVADEIRRTGMYMTDSTLETMKRDPQLFDQLMKRYADEREKTRQLQEQIDRDRPLTNLGAIVLSQKGAIMFQSAAQFLSQHGIPTGQNRLFKYCRNKKLLCSRKGKQWNRPTQTAIERGLFNVEVSGGFNAVTMITPKGLHYLTTELVSETYPLLVLMESEID